MSFGLPDYSAGAMNEQGAREVLRREIERCVKQFEPRLVHVSVSLLPRKDDLDTTLQLRIDALLRAEPVDEQISFDTIVNAATAEVEVTGG
jgi:type VI secretion system protein ImpF